MKLFRAFAVFLVLAISFVFGADNIDKQAREAVNKAVKNKTIPATDMSKYIERINKGKGAEVLKELSGDSAADGSTAVGAISTGVTDWPKDKVVGWRGDGTGVYPKSNPPTTWNRTESGSKTNILWETKLPCYTWSTPIVVGDKIFTHSEPYDIVCLNKNTGKVLWMHSVPAIVTVSEEEKKANPAYKQVSDLLEQLEQLNKNFVSSGWQADTYQKKHDLSKQLNEKLNAIDPKYRLPPDQYVESWCGYTAPTPCSDGKNIYFNSGNGVTACYDLEGNKKWARYQSVAQAWGEHGFPNSSTISADLFMAPSIDGLHAINKETGVDVWLQKVGGCNATVPFKYGGTDYIVYGGNYIRSKDGKVMVARGGDMASGTPVVMDNTAFFGTGTIYIYKLESGGSGLSIKPTITDEYNRIGIGQKDNPAVHVDPSIAGFATATTLYDKGLLYCLGNFGWFVVFDASKTTKNDKNAIVYTNYPEFDFKNNYSRKTFGMGIGASPILAGKYIYMIDSAGCTIVMEPGRSYKKIAKNNIDCTIAADWESNYYAAPHHEQFEASPIADGNHLYMRGEQYLYCIGEK